MQRDLTPFAAACQTAIGPDRLASFARSLGVSADALRKLGVGWATADALRDIGTNCRSTGCWTFPMTDAAGRVAGIRLRTPDGFKYAVTGGREGLFFPSDLASGERLFVTEGPTDAAALLTLGLNAIGRPSCTGGVRQLAELCRKATPPEVVIVADSDAPGQRGAESLATVLAVYVARVRTLCIPNFKDVRAWVQAGATAADVQALADAAPARTLNITRRSLGRRAVAHAK